MGSFELCMISVASDFVHLLEDRLGDKHYRKMLKSEMCRERGSDDLPLEFHVTVKKVDPSSGYILFEIYMMWNAPYKSVFNLPTFLVVSADVLCEHLVEYVAERFSTHPQNVVWSAGFVRDTDDLAYEMDNDPLQTFEGPPPLPPPPPPMPRASSGSQEDSPQTSRASSGSQEDSPPMSRTSSASQEPLPWEMTIKELNLTVKIEESREVQRSLQVQLNAARSEEVWFEGELQKERERLRVRECGRGSVLEQQRLRELSSPPYHDPEMRMPRSVSAVDLTDS